ncbi:MAG: GldG family protein, partial [Myxococcales bacterium]|nr:GldG family protein [Myxococcales bacterium]
MTQDKQEEVEAPEAEGAAAAGAEVAEATGAAPPGGKPSGGEPPGDRTLGTRRTVATLHASAGSLLVVAIVLMLNYLAYRHYERWDWTSDGVFTLSQRTEEVVRGLDRGIEIFVLLSEGEQELDAVRELTERYKALNPLVTVRQIDPDRQRGEYTLLAERFDLAQGPMADVAIVVAGSERHWKITRDDLLELDMGSLDSSDGPKLDVKSEQALTGAILQVVRGRATRVCASSGHGEWTLDPGGERSLAAASETLRRDNVELESLETLGLEAIPERCDALWIISPLRPLGEDEVERIGAYLEAGGNALLTLDPVLDGDRVQRTGFEGLLGVLGAFAEPCLVLEMDQARLLTPSPVQAFLTVDFGDHPTTQLLQATQGLVVMDIARSVRVIEGSTAVALIRSSE